MHVYTCTFSGIWLGGSAVVLAHNEEEAREMLMEAVVRHNDEHYPNSHGRGEELRLDVTKVTFKNITSDVPIGYILDDGNY